MVWEQRNLDRTIANPSRPHFLTIGQTYMYRLWNYPKEIDS